MMADYAGRLEGDDVIWSSLEDCHCSIIIIAIVDGGLIWRGCRHTIIDSGSDIIFNYYFRRRKASREVRDIGRHTAKGANEG